MKLDLSDGRSRLLLAAAVSIAIHEAVAGLVPPALWRPSPSQEVITRARIVRVALHPLAATPTPQPLHAAEPARPVAAAQAAPHRAAAAAPHPARVSTHRIVTLVPSHDRPIWDAAGRENGHAIVASTGAGSNGGAGASGAGDGAPASDTRPCGFVTFSDPHGSQYDSRTRGFWVDIRMAVRFSDGSTQSMILDYPWYYPSEAANPWSDANLRDPNFPTRFQQPPPAKAPGEPPLVQYVMTHSTADGLTLLRDCPAPSRAAETP